MKFLSNSLLVILLLVQTSTYAQSWAWTRQAVGGTGNNYANGLCVDKDDNTYITGRVKNTGLFGDGTNTVTMNVYGDRDVYISKYNSNGVFKWAHHYGGTLSDYGYAIDDDSLGNTFLTGHFTNAGTFGPFNLTTSGASDIFLAKHDSLGNILWVKKYGGVNSETSLAICVRGNSVYVTGWFLGTAVFDTDTLVSVGNEDMFIMKLDLNGNQQWVKRFGGAFDDEAIGCTVDVNGQLLVTGTFTGAITFGSTSLTSTSPSVGDIFVLKMDTNGNVIWAKNKGSASAEYGQNIITDKWGNIFITGVWAQTSIITVKYSPTGTQIWQLIQGSSGLDIGNDITVDTLGDVYISGYFSATIIMGGDTLLCNGPDNFFVEKISSGGVPLWTKNSSALASEHCFSLDITSKNELMVGAAFTGNATFQGVTYNNAGGTYDALLGKLIQPVTAQFTVSDNSICVGDTVVLTGGINGFPTQYSWTATGATIVSSNANTITLVYLNAGAYNVTLVASHGAIEKDTLIIPSAIIVSSPDPAFSVSPSLVTTCVNDTAWLSVSSAYSQITWSSGQIGYSIPSLDSGFYFVSALDASGCAVFDTALVQYFPSINYSLGSDTTACFGSLVLLNAGSGYSFYNWMDTSSAQFLNATISGNYWSKITDSNGCEYSDTVSVLFAPQVTPQLGNDIFICPGDSALLNPGSFQSYFWSTSDVSPTVYASATGYYWVLVTDSMSCQGSDTVWINNYAVQPLSIGPDTSLCSPTMLLASTNSYTNYVWSDFSTGNTLLISTPGNYWLQVTDSNTCIQTDSLFVDICDGIDENSVSATITVFPNPVNGNDWLTLECLSVKPQSVELITLLGQRIMVIYELSFENNLLRVKLNNVADGVYQLILHYSNAEKGLLLVVK